MTLFSRLKLSTIALSGMLITGCFDGGSKGVIKHEIESPAIDHGQDHDHTVESKGRLVLLNQDKSEAHVFDLDQRKILESFTLSTSSVALQTSAGGRYALLSDRQNDVVSFIDGGLWQENHDDHQHSYAQTPAFSDFELHGFAPTHITYSDENTIVFNDGNAATGANASIQIIDDTSIANRRIKATLNFEINMHGVAKLQQNTLFATVRRGDDESTSNAKILPDQIGVYELHEDHFHFDSVLDITCPDLHGAAQNHEAVAFACRDGVVITHSHDGHFESDKITNIEAIADLRIGTLFGHHGSNTFLGTASNRATGEVNILTITPDESEMALLDWQPVSNAQPISYAFNVDGTQFLILDNQGYLTVVDAHQHDGHAHWTFKQRIDVSKADISTLSEDQRFGLVVSKRENTAYVTDSAASTILVVNITTGEIEDTIALTFTPSSMTWLGIPEGDQH
ncbi:5-methyltetrahydrofolate--homocysteine methyltransferase [Pseudoalteromonas xiamenensis]|uniref:5-methyltetrahydrofolate--homocysteine methyltransferase n=1 Tax=Pseudoalteromonas xiamenensis TaxID=882626 RepID=UPI0035EA32DB